MLNTTEYPARRALTVEEAARVLGIGRSSAYAAAREGTLPTVKVGKRLIVPEARLRAMLGETEPFNENSATAGNRDAVQKSSGGDARHETYKP